MPYLLIFSPEDDKVRRAIEYIKATYGDIVKLPVFKSDFTNRTGAYGLVHIIQEELEHFSQEGRNELITKADAYRITKDSVDLSKPVYSKTRV